MSKKRHFFILASCIAVGLVGCSTGEREADQKLLPYTEVVLKPGMKVTATNANGTVTIEAGEETKRIFQGDGWKQEKNLISRKKRWYGSLGLYDPAGSNSPYGRLLVDEGRLYFSSVSEALKYLYVGSLYFKPVYTNNGLVLGYSIEKAAKEEKPVRSVQLWQIYINGVRPTAIPGANDSAFSISGGEIPETSTPHPAPVGYTLVLGKEEYRPQ